MVYIGTTQFYARNSGKWLVTLVVALSIFSAASLLLADEVETRKSHDPYYDGLGDWESNDTQGDINFSTFVFRDVNRNGTYDEGDREMPGVITYVLFDGKKLERRFSNKNGFANFKASRFDDAAVIKALGQYTFRVEPPPGWGISTDNQEQTANLIDVFGSIGGVAFEAMPKAIGLICPLYISGRINAVNGSSAKQRVSLRGRIGKEKTVKSDEKGYFIFQGLAPGDYWLEADGNTRAVTLKDTAIHVGTLTEVADQPNTLKNIRVASFDDFTNSNDLTKVHNGYAGLSWFNLNAIHGHFSKNAVGYINGIHSGEFLAYTSSGHPASIRPYHHTRDVVMDFHSVYVATAWKRAHLETAIFTHWRQGKQVLEDAFPIGIFAPVHYQPYVRGVDEVRIQSKHYWQILLDDVAVSTQPVVE